MYFNFNPFELKTHDLMIGFICARAAFGLTYLIITYLRPNQLRVAGTLRLVCFTIDQALVFLLLAWFIGCDLQTLW